MNDNNRLFKVIMGKEGKITTIDNTGRLTNEMLCWEINNNKNGKEIEKHIQHAKKTAAHRAEADVYESINELRFYRDTIFAQSS